MQSNEIIYGTHNIILHNIGTSPHSYRASGAVIGYHRPLDNASRALNERYNIRVFSIIDNRNMWGTRHAHWLLKSRDPHVGGSWRSRDSTQRDAWQPNTRIQVTNQ